MLSSRKAAGGVYHEDAHGSKRAKRWEVRDAEEDELEDDVLGGASDDEDERPHAEKKNAGMGEEAEEDMFVEDVEGRDHTADDEDSSEHEEDNHKKGKKGKKGKKHVLGANDAKLKSLETAVFGHGEDAIKDVISIYDKEPVRGPVLDDKVPAWVDEDDEEVSVDIGAQARLRKLRDDADDEVVSGSRLESKLRRQFEKLHGRPAWAQEDLRTAAIEEHGDVDGDDTALLRSTKPLLASSRSRLIRGVVDISRLADANQAKRSSAVVQAVHFHPSAPAILTAGLDKTLRIFQVDGRRNKLMSSTFVRNLPMYSAAFSPDGTEVIMSGRRPFFYSFDLETGSVTCTPYLAGRKEQSLERMCLSPDNQFITFTGRDGHMLLVSRKTKQLIGTLKMNQSCRKAAFSRDSRYLYTTGNEGRVYIWDMNTRDCINVFEDEGCQIATAIAVSPDNKSIAVGSDAGVVNVYDDVCMSSRAPKPRKSFLNLTTTIDNLSFNHDGSVLCMSSRMRRNAIRLVHMPSLTVFKNWPSTRTNLRFTHSQAFSPHGKYLALGNDGGQVPLLRLNHFAQY
ncbi:hypothetical protein PTSG_04968 [Salpingoeca rosetta]|uniref:U3 small nucleolar RNA-associated protein 18 homolog n=1 Tax=Salpingoeca rosetta (strain ATCC 50818 / BSB-021) TaxID=946362 RepID=F2U952_SALR5|nr:uncharacterized protein PTSG_04968 [Salpingoeca rosetta]EGD73255.1 hypothetical protein PTSG_04968 [Salpingoeca rosetta]|eukprot:XP_004994286.1 hypothetical protein PTSG_04968 [Salpingoeca rosetta]